MPTTLANVQPLTIQIMIKHIYGYDYEVVSTESAKRAILNCSAFHEVKDLPSHSDKVWEQI